MTIVTSHPRQINIDQERRILTGCITDTRYLQSIYPFFKQNYFQVPYAQRIYGWVREYYKQYNEAPKERVSSLFQINKEQMNPEEATLVEGFLADLSLRYERGEFDSSSNHDFELDQTVLYAKERDILSRTEKARALAQAGRIEDAEREFNGYQNVARSTSNWVNPNDPEEIRKTFENEDYNRLIRFPGKLGYFLGWFKRRWLIAVQGPAKRGKSWMLQEIRTLGLMNSLKVVEINLEMSKEELKMRYYKRIANMPAPDEPEGEYLYPVFDCQSNQDGSCMNRNRTSSVPLMGEGREEGIIPDYGKHNPEYRPCVHCRNNFDSDEYIPATWYEPIVKERLTVSKIESIVNAFGLMYGSNNYRLICYPRFSANIDDINRDLDNLYYTEEFTPDIIIPDYADIIGVRDRKLSPIDRIDDTWMALARMASERHALVATGTHSNIRRVEGKKRQKAGDVSGDTRKLNHVDLMVALDQTPFEAIRGVMRIGKIEQRQGKPDLRQVTILQQFGTGQSLLDSEWCYGED